MNVFSTFTFGHLIKTFLPGLVWLSACVLVYREAMQWAEFEIGVLKALQADPSAAVVLAIPSAMILGLMSNVLIFMGLNDFVVRRPVYGRNEELLGLYKDLSDKIRHKYCNNSEFLNVYSRRSDVFDPEIVMLHYLGFEKFNYIRHQYWYYLEFCINLAFSVIVLLLALFVASFSLNAPVSHILLFDLFLVTILLFFAGMLLCAARKNYVRHISKMVCLMATW